MAISLSERERLARLEAQQQNTDELTKRLVDSQDNIAKSLQELVSIHREAVARQDADRETLQKHGNELDTLWESHRNLHKHFWRYFWTGTGIFLTLAVIWKAGLLPTLIGALAV